MLFQPPFVQQSISFGPYTFIWPLIPGLWYKVCPQAQAQKVAQLIASIPGAKVELVDYTVQGQNTGQGPLDPQIILPPDMINPGDIRAWGIVGTVPTVGGGTLQVAEYAGGLFDRGPVAAGFGGAPNGGDANGAYGGIGGPNLVFSNVTPGAPAGQGLAEFRWSETPQQPVSA